MRKSLIWFSNFCSISRFLSQTFHFPFHTCLAFWDIEAKEKQTLGNMLKRHSCTEFGGLRPWHAATPSPRDSQPPWPKIWIQKCIWLNRLTANSNYAQMNFRNELFFSLRPNPHRTRDAMCNAMWANGTCWCEWGCPHCMQATSKVKHSNLCAHRVPHPVWIGPKTRKTYLSCAPSPTTYHLGPIVLLEFPGQEPKTWCVLTIILLLFLLFTNLGRKKGHLVSTWASTSAEQPTK